MKKLILLTSSLLFSATIYSQEICGNGSDDDGDGLIDCLDPDCTSSTVPTGALFNTATNGSGGILPGGSNDLNWQCSIGSLAGPYAPAIVMDPASTPGSYATSPWPDCSWISHTASGIHSLDQDFYYKIQFYLPCYNNCGNSYADSSTFCLNMDFFADNSVDEVYVNGIPQSAYIPGVPDPSPYYATGFYPGSGKSLSLCRDWVPGLNELIIKISSGPSWEGFLAQNSTSSPPPTGDPSILSPGASFAVCDSTSPVTFTAASGGGTWTASCGTCINSSTGVFDPSVAGTGTYTVIYTLTVPCPASDTSTIQVLALPPDAAINPEPVHCISDPPFNMSPVSAGGTWSGTGISNPTLGTFNPSLSGAGTFTVTHIISGTCGDTATTTVTVTAGPAPSFTSDVNTGCVPLCVQFNQAGSAGCTSMMYYFGDGDSATTSTSVHCYNTVGLYSVTIECTDANGCTGSATINDMINVSGYPVANFTLSPSADVHPNTTVNFTNTSTGAGSYSWEFDDPASGSSNYAVLADPSHTYSAEGNYCILMMATNAAGCSDSVTYCLIVEDEATIFIPNVFTPNDDHSNDVFIVSSNHMKDISYDIYDRWGLKLAEYNGLTGGWDGKAKNGRLAPDGTYYYILRATTNKGKLIEKEGYIQLLSKQ